MGNTQTILEALVEHKVQLCLIEGPAMRQRRTGGAFHAGSHGLRGARGA